MQDVDLPASGTVVQQGCVPIRFADAVDGAGCVLDTAAVLRVPQVTAVRRPFRLNV